MQDYVVLVDGQDRVLGIMPKNQAHNERTPLHRGFSLFLFNDRGELLLQQRSLKKKTWPGVWSNSVCGHPMLDEKPIEAAKRRLSFELGIEKAEITMALPDYRYRVEKDGIVENEICPVMIGFSNEMPKPNPDEVNAVRWIAWRDWLGEAARTDKNYSEWCVEETQLLNKNPNLKAFLKKPPLKML